MDHQYFWDYTTTTAAANSVSRNGPFTSNVSSYFRNPSKVVKSNSRNSSPRNNGGRRRMTTSGHFPAPRTRSVVDHQRASMPQLSHYQAAPNRPISWHPNSLVDLPYLQLPSQPVIESTLASPYTISENNGLVTPMSFPVTDEPQIQELITPLEELLAHDPTNMFYDASQDFSMETWLSRQQMKNQHHVHTAPYPDMNYQSWYDDDQGGVLHMMMSSASPTFSPMPEFGTHSADQPENITNVDKDELVGMGLYDSPADVQSSSLLFTSKPGSLIRKALKLEDAFEPAPPSDDETENTHSMADDEDDAPGEPDDELLGARAVPYDSTTSHTVNHPTASGHPSYLGLNHHKSTNSRQWDLSQDNTSSAWI